MKYHNIFTLLLLLSLLITFNSCEKDEPEAPELPPLEAFAMDFSDFDNPNYAGTLKKSSQNLIDPYRNFGYSYLTVAAWNTVASFVMAIPTATYAAALNDTPEYLGDNTWEWEFNVQVESFSYSARLVAQRISNQEFMAEMFVSSSSSHLLMNFEDFKWFEGVIRYDHTHAEWTLFESPSNPVALLTMEWNRDYETELWDITYTNVKADDNENGSFIKFEQNSDLQYNAKYTVFTSEGNIIIEWNPENKSGRVMSEIYFEDNLWHCWNAMFVDMDC